MSQFIEIHWTTGSIDEARKVSRYLAQQRLAACCQIIPWVESIYLWNRQLETSQETKVVIKTRLELYDTIKEIIQDNSSYEVPEILYSLIDGGNSDYMDWLEECIEESSVEQS